MFFKRKKASSPKVPRPGMEGRRPLSAPALSARTVGVDSPALAAQYPALFAQWRSGDVSPAAITLAFDPKAQGGRGRMFSSTQFVGPWVDEACGAQQPAVDRWEQGLLYPTWEQLCRLAALTQTPLDTLLNCPDTPNFLNGCSQVPTAFALRQSFHPAIVSATVNAHPDQTPLDEMAKAINQAISAIMVSIEAKTDPLTLFINGLRGENEP